MSTSFAADPASRVLHAIVRQHAEDAAFYWARHDDAIASTEHDWQSLRRMEQLLEAHLEGLRVAQIESAPAGQLIGDAARSATRTRLARWGTHDESFVAAVVALHALEVAGVDAYWSELHAMAQYQLDASRGAGIATGMAHALAHRRDGIAEGIVASWWATENPPWRRAALVAAVPFGSLHPSLLHQALASDQAPSVQAEAARLAGAAGIAQLVPTLLGRLQDPASSPAVRCAAAAAIGRLTPPSSAEERGWRLADAVLLDAWTTSPDQLDDVELSVWLWRSAPTTTNSAIERMLREGGEDRARWRQALRAIRLQSDARWLPLVLQCIDHQSRSEEIRQHFVDPSRNLARLAGDVFAHISGIKIGHQLWREAPEPPDGVGDDMLDSPYVTTASKRDLDGALLWPDFAKLQETWSRIADRFEPGRRYVAGELVTESTLLRTLGNAKSSQQLRWQAALLLQLARGEGPCFDVGASTMQQEQMLIAWGANSWNW